MSKQIDPVPARAAAYVALYPMLLQIAKDHGYSLCVHGSVHRDLDLVAVPWIEEASEPLALILAFKEAVGAVVHHEEMDKHYPDCDPKQKPHGRVAYSLHVTNRGMYGGYLDVSLMPRVPAPNAKPWVYEDELPEDITDTEYAVWFLYSIVDGVRLGPRIEGR